MSKKRAVSWNRLAGVALLAGVFLLASGCGGPADPIQKISRTLSGIPTFSIVLEDMKEEGNFFKDYFHKYKVMTPQQTKETGWMEVSKDHFENYMPFLGMTVYVKKDGKETHAAGPPGYEYVGDKRYGSWQRDSSGNSFWAFYGQYAMLSHLLGSGPIYRNHYNDYTRYSSSQRPYYGPKNQYGTKGSYTKSQKPNFYSRRTSQEMMKKSSFSQRVNQRVGRTRTVSRSRSGSVGK